MKDKVCAAADMFNQTLKERKKERKKGRKKNYLDPNAFGFSHSLDTRRPNRIVRWWRRRRRRRVASGRRWWW